MKSRSQFSLWSKFRTSGTTVLQAVSAKSPLVTIRSRLHTQSTICSFQYFDQFSDLDLRQNIFNLIIFISNTKLPWAVSFEFSSHYIQKENSLSANPHDHIEPQQIKEYSIICASYIRKGRKELNHSVLL